MGDKILLRSGGIKEPIVFQHRNAGCFCHEYFTPRAALTLEKDGEIARKKTIKMRLFDATHEAFFSLSSSPVESTRHKTNPCEIGWFFFFLFFRIFSFATNGAEMVVRKKINKNC